MTAAHNAGPLIIREILKGLEDSGPQDEWADISRMFTALDMDQRVRLAVRITSILTLSNLFHVGKRRL